MTGPNVDPAAARAFIEALTGSVETVVTWQTFTDAKPKPEPEGWEDPLARILHGAFPDVARELTALSNRGAGIFVMVNVGDLKGRAGRNVVAPRALFVDHDSPPLRPYAIQPSFRVRSSADRSHAYWILANGENLADFKPAQQLLIAWYGADPGIHDLPHVMRVPGFPHQKSKPQRVTFVPGTGARHSIADVVAAHAMTDREKAVMQHARTRTWTPDYRHESAKMTTAHARHMGLSEEEGRRIVGDLLEASGKTRGEAEALVRDLWKSIPPPRALGVSAPPPTIEWLAPPPPLARPKLAKAALRGIAGRFVETVAPHTEAHPLGLLAAFMTMFGTAVGRSPHFRIGAARHGGNLFVTLVGLTSSGRKGTAVDEAVRLFKLADQMPPRAGGLSSGEGFVYAIRDEIRTLRPVREKGKVIDHEEVIEDPGVEDKRLIVIESELASVLARMGREGNTLSSLMRQAWDGQDLGTMTKKAIRATGPHVSLLAQITPAELSSLMTETDTLNGWANRMLFCSVGRLHVLPFGGGLSDHELLPLACELREAIELASHTGQVERDPEAQAAWGRVYEPLSSDRPGLLGAVTARAPQHVMRLALLYALLDRETWIRAPHLAAALAFWQASQESAQAIFGTSLGDRIADDILEELRTRGEAGMTRDEMREHFQRNVPSARIKASLDTLARAGLAAGRKESPAGPGRPAERWFAGARPYALNAVDAEKDPAAAADGGITALTAFPASGGDETRTAGGAA